MTTRGQNLRSTIPGQVPAVNTRQPGEIWMTFPDLQLGVIDTARTAQKLIAIRFFSATANYVAGDFVVQGGKLYFAKGAVPAGAFNAGQWTQIAALTDIPALYVLPTASTTVLGGVKVDGASITIASGVISSNSLVAVSTTPPASPLNGALWYDLIGGQLYVWMNDGSSSQWVIVVNQSIGGVFLPLTGGALTGPLTLAGDPVNPLDASTKQYSDKAPRIGVVDGSAAAGGQVGERLLASVSPAAAWQWGASQSGVITSFTLSPGDWDVRGSFRCVPGYQTAGAGTALQWGYFWIGTNSAATLPSDPLPTVVTAGGANVNLGAGVGPMQFRVSASTPVFLMGALSLVGGNSVAGISGWLEARRMR